MKRKAITKPGVRHADRALVGLTDSLQGLLPRIRSLGLMQFDPVWGERWHQSAHSEMLHVTRGVVRLEMGNDSFTARPGDTLIVPSGVLHRDRFDLNEGLEIFFCSFEWPMIHAFLAVVDNRILLGLPDSVKNEIGSLFDQLRADRKGLSEAERLVTSGRLLGILLLLLETADSSRRSGKAPVKKSSPAQVRRSELMQQAKLYLDRHYARPLTLDDIAGALKVSPYHLSHVFSEESEFSLFVYLTVLRMAKAKVLLRERRLTVAEVATAVGYDDASYFAKVFHKHAGCSPRDFAAASLRQAGATKYPK